ncbi:nucleotidyltransferase family protein [Herbivorax sp. ANBcel31]|uniref:nucleotidyltransferase domain-containing protein n=1 Tax=Herbivorax sp. ANBcel31 TaxID=3069754 RepID=UPI0027B21972|nr:nucleotidyltransferase family protein [Herbivorax sp. ANBcel31]MDQ2087368.1 nucleotidyltransferase family protein [Herbivorax sp. ANBcel31]
MKNVEKEKSYLIHLISRAIHEKQAKSPPKNLKWASLYKLACYHNVSNIIYYPLKGVEDKYKMPKNIWQNICNEYKKSVGKEATQHVMTEMILEEFEKNKIECMPLKGYFLKYLYPKVDMRTMGDIDILYKDNKTSFVRKIMKDMNYSIEKIEDKHDKYYKKPFMTIEMHKSLVGNLEPYASYYKNVWDKLKTKKNFQYIYQFSKEDFYIFLMVHFTKHYVNNGVGVRSIVDIWVYNSKFYDNMDWNYIKCELEKIKLDEFEENIRGLSQFWFESEKCNEEDNELYDLMGDYILSSGVYGTIKNGALAGMSREFEDKRSVKRLKHFHGFKMLFPNLNGMKKRFEILNKFPFLLPVFWIYRLVRGFLFRRERSFKKVESVYSASKKDISKILDLHTKAGLYK